MRFFFLGCCSATTAACNRLSKESLLTASPTSSGSGALRLAAAGALVETKVGAIRAFFAGRDSKTVGPARQGGRGFAASVGTTLVTLGGSCAKICACGV